MARAYFDQNPFGAAPIEPGLDVIRRTYSQKAPTPMASLSKAIQEPFVTDVIVPGISRIRDEMRIAEQEEQIAAQAEAKRAAAAQFLQQAAAAEQQGLDAEVAAAVGALPPLAIQGSFASPLSRLSTGLYKASPSPYQEGSTEYDPSIPEAAESLLGPREERLIDGRMRRVGHASLSMRAAKVLEMERLYGREQGELANKIREALISRGLGDVVAEIDQGVAAEDAIREGAARFQQTQERRATIGATQRFERALAGELPQVAAAEGAAAQQALTPMMVNGRPGVRTRGYEGDEEQGRIDAIATRAYRRALKDGKSREESVAIGMEAARAAQPEAAPAQAAQPQAIQSPESIERANRLREQATALEAEATGIEGTPVYRTFGDHAMAFLDALDSGDVATQMALMESVGGSTDYQPFGKGAVGKAIGKDASMRARKDLLDLKKKYLDAKRREDSAIRLAEKKAELRGKKKRTGGRGGGGYGRKDKVLMDALVALNRGDSLTENDKRLLRATKELTPAEIESLTPDRPAAWQALRTSMRGKRARADAKSIMSGQPTPEEREVRKVAAAEKAEQNAIKKLEAEVRLATGDEKKRKAQELARMKLDAKIGSAATRLDTAAEDLIKAEFAVDASLREQSQLLAAIGKEANETKKANLQDRLENAQARQEPQERIRVTLAAKKKRLDKELKALEARRRAMPAKANP